jgi:hypothetical protein
MNAPVSCFVSERPKRRHNWRGPKRSSPHLLLSSPSRCSPCAFGGLTLASCSQLVPQSLPFPQCRWGVPFRSATSSAGVQPGGSKLASIIFRPAQHRWTWRRGAPVARANEVPATTQGRALRRTHKGASRHGCMLDLCSPCSCMPHCIIFLKPLGHGVSYLVADGE